MTPIEPTTPISVTLEAQEWNAVLATLSEGPFKIVAPLIQKITEQAQTQAGQQPPNPNQIGAKPNGSGVAEHP